MRRLVMVAGAGRSGTSTMAGALSLLGLHVPEPQVESDETNPRGFFESRWVVDYHRELLNRSPLVRVLDARPEAIDLADQRASGPRNNTRLGEFLDSLADHDQVVVKDPRAIWFHRLWRQAVTDRDVELSFVSMLRHPLEVIASRDTWYTPDVDDAERRHRTTASLAGWLNTTLTTERVTRGDRRRFARYDELVEDWRAALTPVVEALGLDVAPALTTRPHPVDDFVGSPPERPQLSWIEAGVPDALRALAERTWLAVVGLVDRPDDAAVTAELDRIAADYALLHDDAVGLAFSHTLARETHVRRTAKANITADYEERVHELEQQLSEANGGEGWIENG